MMTKKTFADLDVHGARREEEARAIAHADHDGGQNHREEAVVVLEDAAQPVVHEPADGKDPDADRHGRDGIEGRDRSVDQVGVGVEVVQHHEQHEAAQPGGVRLPFEPGEPLRQRRRRHAELLDPVEAAAVDLPRLTADAALGVTGIGGGSK
jgi:hypothetical protein